MKQLFTKWGQEFNPNSILPEYPRPGMVRDSYLNLNGVWEYGIVQDNAPESYQGTILVPFSPETYLSGVGKILKPHETLYYRKRFTVPDGFKKVRVLLHFGAVDQECRVFLNSTCLGGHKGGYLPFTFDITDSLTDGENILTLAVKDRTEQAPYARGKQKLAKKGKYASLFYTPQSGIWKTVWLESVEENYIKSFRITPVFDSSSVRFHVIPLKKGEPISIEILDGFTRIVQGQADMDGHAEFFIPEMIPWTPDNPHLYDVRIQMGKDIVQSYFGMRKISTGRDKNGILRFFLNNRPIFFNGILDQGYWPESLLTPPSDEALMHDILTLKSLGFNTIRKHIKIESDRFYYHCDKLGMLVWQDMPNGGGDYNMIFVTYLANAFDWFARGVRDSHYRLFKRQDPEGRRQYYRELAGMVSHLYNFPSIAVWVPFNEGWGQFDARKATVLIRRLDKTRLVNEACGWFDQGGGDMYSIHNYVHRLKIRPQPDRVVALTEYGGYAYPIREHMACEKQFGYKHYHSQKELTENYKRLWTEEILPNLKNGLSSAIYTQTSDVEEEINGIMTYDRELIKPDAETVRSLNRQLTQKFCQLTEFLPG